MLQLCLDLATDTTADARTLVRAGLHFFEQHPPPRPPVRPRFISLLRLTSPSWHDDLDTLRRVVVLLEGGHLQWVDLGARARLLAHDLPNASFDALFDRDPVCVLSLSREHRELVRACRLAGAPGARALLRAGISCAHERRTAHLNDVLNYFERTLRAALEWPGAGEPLVPCRRWPVLGARVVSAGKRYYAAGRWSVARLHWLALGLSTGPLSAAAAFAWSYAAARTHYRFADCDVDATAPLRLVHWVPPRWPRALGWDDAIVVTEADAWVLRWWLRAVGDAGGFDWQRNVGSRNGRVFFGLGLLASWDPRLGGGVGAAGNAVLLGLHEFRCERVRPFARLCPRKICWDTDDATVTITRAELRRYSTFLVSKRAVDARPHCVVWFVRRSTVYYYNPDRPPTARDLKGLAETLDGCLGARVAARSAVGGGTPDQDGSERSCFLLSLARALMVAHSNDPRDLLYDKQIGHPWLLLVSLIWRELLQKDEERALWLPGAREPREICRKRLFAPLLNSGAQEIGPLRTRLQFS